jgi:hypothetical protein
MLLKIIAHKYAKAKDSIMPKMRTYQFDYFDQGVLKKDSIDALGWRRAVKQFQGKVKVPDAQVTYLTKRGAPMSYWMSFPVGRKRKLGLDRKPKKKGKSGRR